MKMTNIFRLIILLGSIAMFGIGFGFGNLNIMLVSVLMLLSNNIIYALESFAKNIVFLLFNISFFTFLLGQYFVDFISLRPWSRGFPDDIVVHTLTSLFISLLFLYWGASFAAKRIEMDKITQGSKADKHLLVYIRNVSKVMLYLTYIVAFAVLLEKVLFVQQNGYVALYMDYSSKIPFLIKKIALTSTTFFYIYLSTMPLKREAKTVVILQLIYLITSVLTGVRGILVVGLFTMVAYSAFRDKYYTDYDKKWIGRTEKKIGIVLLPFFLAFLSAYASIRVSGKFANFNIISGIGDFFKSQGSSVQVISYSKLYEEFLPLNNKSYVFGPIIKHFTIGTFASLITGLTSLTDKVDIALYGNNLGATITYLVSPQYYLSGGGFGTQYIAELYADLGYAGIAIFNFIIGIVLINILSKTSGEWWFFAIGLLTCNAIFDMPRNFALAWIGVWYALPTWLPILFSWVCAKVLYERKFVKARCNMADLSRESHSKQVAKNENSLAD